MDHIRLSRKELLILGMLVAKDGLYGLEMMRASGGTLPQGTVYATLGRMKEKGFVRSETEPAPAGKQGAPRRKYYLTDLGERVQAVFSELLKSPPAGTAGGGLKLRPKTRW